MERTQSRQRKQKKKSKGTYAAFDSRIPYWIKFIQVHDWKNNMRVREALKEEEGAQHRADPTDG